MSFARVQAGESQARYCRGVIFLAFLISRSLKLIKRLSTQKLHPEHNKMINFSHFIFISPFPIDEVEMSSIFLAGMISSYRIMLHDVSLIMGHKSPQIHI